MEIPSLPELQTACIWRMPQPEDRKLMLTGHKSSVEAVAYSPDGKTLASTSLDGTMLLWDFAGNLKVEPVQLVGDFNSDGVC